MNSSQGVFMDVPVVRGMAKRFGTISDVLKNVSRALQALLTVLKATAFIGSVGNFAMIQLINQIKPFIDEMAKKTAEISKDLGASVNAYERGDQQGATRFY